MTLLKIARMGHPALLSVAQPVEDLSDPALQTLIDDMIDTMHDSGGVGLAAPQVHVSKRIFVYHVPPSRQEEGEEAPADVQVLINPVITPASADKILRMEGCLSIPGMRGWVPRYTQVRYVGTDRNGHPVSGFAQGFHANVIQHEADHLDGILYPMRMTDLGLMGFDAEANRFLTPDKIAGYTV
ncbi:peptide deformylase [Acetobacter conturbans]|uniref:Peptide deformylase n=1 Tax=Acetobacter conturbans TaxID=1737472 RepID=A0ABX0K549_9PROT|nr:peptide deformylase [Acetobacter conturbans]NHN89740.1 peptide deformylase [Acetobacter conturbans]